MGRKSIGMIVHRVSLGRSLSRLIHWQPFFPLADQYQLMMELTNPFPSEFDWDQIIYASLSRQQIQLFQQTRFALNLIGGKFPLQLLVVCLLQEGRHGEMTIDQFPELKGQTKADPSLKSLTGETSVS